MPTSSNAMETETTYTPPELLEEMDDEAIHRNMLANLPPDIDKTEGGFAYDFTKPAALEAAEMMIDINEAVQLYFPEWAYGTFLDKHAREVGLQRRGATCAETDLRVTGSEGTVIPVGFLFATTSTEEAENVEFATTAEVTLEAGPTTVHVRCTEAGLSGNVPQNSITLMSTPMSGIQTVNNPEAATGGTEEESDEDLAARIKDRDLNQDSSFVGNDSDYRRWAMEVNGVGTVNVIPEWQGKGTGTVKLIIMDSNGAPANPTLLKQVEDHIMGPDGDRSARLAPIGAILTVVTATAMDISISARVTLQEGADIDTVTTAFKQNALRYFEEAKEAGYVLWTRVGSVLSATQGVYDYTELTIDGGTDNLPIEAEDYPSLGEVTLTEQGG